MNRYTVELDLVPHALVEIIPGVTVQQQLGETVHIRIEIGPVTKERDAMLRDLAGQEKPDADQLSDRS